TPIPGITRGLTWTFGERPAPQSRLSLKLTNVSAPTLDTAEAAMPAGVIEVAGDGETTLGLSRLPLGTRVSLAGRTVMTTTRARRRASVRLPKGTSEVTLAAGRRRR